MMIRSALVLLLPFALLLSACSTADSGDTAGPVAEDWSVKQGALTLEEDLRLGETEDFFFGSINDVAVRRDGRIYVADRREHHVKVLSPEGALTDVIGEQGQGPGEFQFPWRLGLARGDSLFVFDIFSRRLSVFTPKHEFAYSFTVRTDGESANGFFATGEGYYFHLTQPETRDNPQPLHVVRPATRTGILGDTLLTARSMDRVTEHSGNSVQWHRIPYGRSSQYALGPDNHLHYAWSDSLHVAVYNSAGMQLRTVEVPFEAVPVTQEDRNWQREWRSDENWAAVRDKVPEIKPAFLSFLVDDAGRYWFKRPTEEHERVEWWVADADAQQVSTFSLPRNVTLLEVREGRAYGRTEGAYGEPVLVRYRVTEQAVAAE